MRTSHAANNASSIRVSSCVELCSYEENEFVERAYFAILGRFPDPVGRCYYLARLRAGYSKIDLLDQLYRSAENKHSSEPIAGFFVRLKKHRRASRPGLAWVYSLFGYSHGNSRSERQSRALVRQLSNIRAEIKQFSHEFGVTMSVVARDQHRECAPFEAADSGMVEALTAANPVVNEAPIAQTNEDHAIISELTQEFQVPNSADSRRRQLVNVLQREIHFQKRLV